MNTAKILEQKDEMYEHLMEAYEIAGSLRDTFTDIENEGKLKAFCNTIRTKIYELRELKGQFTQSIKSIK